MNQLSWKVIVALFLPIYKEHILPDIKNRFVSLNFVEHFYENNFTFTQKFNLKLAHIVTAFSSAIQKSILIYVLDNNDKRVVFFCIAKSVYLKVQKILPPKQISITQWY